MVGSGARSSRGEIAANFSPKYDELEIFTVACVWVSLLFVPPTALAQRKPKIIMVTHGQAADSFWLIVRNGAEAAAEETKIDCNIVLRTNST